MKNCWIALWMFVGLPAGAYRVTVTKEGFAPAARDVVVVSGSAPTLHFQLFLAVPGSSGDVREHHTSGLRCFAIALSPSLRKCGITSPSPTAAPVGTGRRCPYRLEWRLYPRK